MEEEWRPCPEFESTHEVSNIGRIRSVPRLYAGGRKRLDGKPTLMLIKGKFLAISMSPWGYPRVDISVGHLRRGRVVHKLVAEAFIGPAPSSTHQVNHINGVKTDSRVCNLEWVTPQDNTQHAYDNGLKVPARGYKSSLAKLTEQQAHEIRRLSAQGMSHRKLARMFGVSTMPIFQIIHGIGYRGVD